MATISITVSDEQSSSLPLRTDADGEKETVAAYCQRILNTAATLGASQKRQKEFDALSDAAKDTAIVEGKKV
jgi:hypothetical protein